MTGQKRLYRWMLVGIVGACVILGMRHTTLRAQPPAGGAGQNQRGRWANMTPEERQAAQQKMFTEILQRQGLTETEIEAVKQFQTERQQANEKLQNEFRNLVQAVRFKDATDDQVRAALVKYREAMQQNEAALKEARSKLAAAVHFETRPKVEAALLAMGILDNGLAIGRGMPGMARGLGQRLRGGQGGRRGNPPGAAQ